MSPLLLKYKEDSEHTDKYYDRYFIYFSKYCLISNVASVFTFIYDKDKYFLPDDPGVVVFGVVCVAVDGVVAVVVVGVEGVEGRAVGG